MKTKRLALISVAFLTTVSLKAQVTRYVSTTGPTPAANAVNATSWAAACSDLQAVICVSAPGDEIWVKEGTYVPIYDASAIVFGVPLPPPTPGNRDNAFVLADGVRIYGGFPAFIPNPTTLDRNYMTYVTELNGDLGGINAYHVVLSVSNPLSTLLDGFYIHFGIANGRGMINVFGGMINRDCGGAIYTLASFAEFRHLVVRNHSATHKGGCVYNEHFEGLFSEVDIHYGSADIGAGMCNENCNNISMLNCLIYANHPCINGGGIANIASQNIFITNTEVFGNVAGNNGGGMYNFNSEVHISNCNLYNNAGQSGGGLYNENISNIIIAQSFISNNTALEGAGIYNENSTLTIEQQSCITNNNATGNGGGMHNANTTYTLINVEIGNNAADRGGGILDILGTIGTQYNVLIHDNTATGGAGAGMYVYGSNDVLTNVTIANNILVNTNHQYAAIFCTNGGFCTVRNSIIYANNPYDIQLPSLAVSYSLIEQVSPPGIANLNGLFTQPDFVDTIPNGDYHLSTSPVMSACIDTGNNLYNSIAHDLDGNLRIQNSIIDMGAYETNSPYVSPAPLQGKDGSVLLEDTEVENYKLHLYPTPISKGDFLNLQLSNNDGFYTQNTLVRIFSISGKCVYKQQFSNGKIQIDISFLNSNMYFVQVETDLQTYRTKFGVY